MSSMSQCNSKKNNSSGSSAVNTPASTPVTSVASVSNGQTATQTSPPPNNNAPKYGTLVPNRIFVGGISANTTEDELMQLFNNYGKVKAAKIIQDRAGVSKGYGFITFESEDDAKRLQRDSEDIVLKERKLNIAPAIKKQPFSRAFDGSSPPAVAAGNPAQFYFQPGTIPYFQSGVAYYPPPAAASGDPNTQQPPIYQAPSVYPAQSGPPQTATYPPVIFPAQPMYMPPQYSMPLPYEYNYYPNGTPQYMVGGQGGPQSQVPPLQRPGSPPRQPCYGQQLPYNPEALYYNVPMYGAMEGPTALYQESLDMANGGLTEDSYQLPVDTNHPYHHQQQQQHLHHNHHQSHSHQQDLVVDSSTTPPQVDNGNNGGDLQNHNEHAPSTSANTERQSNTPVVSVLSLDQHQEKDFNSMQSGRRRKLPTPPNNNNNNTYNGYNMQTYPGSGAPYYGYHHPHGNFVPASGGYQTNNGYNLGKYYNNNGGNGGKGYSMNGIGNMGQQHQQGGDRSWGRKQRGGRTSNMERRPVETGSLSSLRTDSNSSASVIADDQKVEEKNVTNSSGVGEVSETPPPPPYSPMTMTIPTKIITASNAPNLRQNHFQHQYNNRGRGGGAMIANHYTNHHNYHQQRATTYNNSRNLNKHHNNNVSATNNNLINNSRSVPTNPTSTPAATTISPPSSASSSSSSSPPSTTQVSQVSAPSTNPGGFGENSTIRGFTDGGATKTPACPQFQVHASGGGTTGATPPQQHFVPPVRRPRRSTRRGGQSLNEIGAGDAPLPQSSSADVGEACKKLDGLKL